MTVTKFKQMESRELYDAFTVGYECDNLFMDAMRELKQKMKPGVRYEFSFSYRYYEDFLESGYKIIVEATPIEEAVE